MKHLFTLCLFFISITVFGQTASFTTSPASNNNTITVCQGSTVLYTNSSTGTNASTNYSWTFQGGNPASANQVGPHNVTYNNPGNYTTTLNLGNGITSQVNVTVVANNLNPSLTLTSTAVAGYSTSTMNGMTIFRRCGYNTGNFSFSDPTIASHPVGTTYALIWGDATPNGTTAPPISHLYSAQGYYNLTYQVTFQGGCVFTQNYLVYVGNSAPTIFLTGSGSSSCLPNPYSHQLGTQGPVPPGTVFQIIYNDGTPTTVLNGLNPNPLTINHVFAQTSCGVNTTLQNQTYNNSFSIQVLASNACTPQGTFAAIGPIAAGGSVNAVMSANPNTNVICVNQPITFNDVSNHGTNVSNGGCDSLFGRYWSISPNSGYTTSGTLGSSNGFLPSLPNGYDFFSWNNGSAALPVTWTSPGNYQVTMYLGNDCGMDSIVFPVTVNNCNPNQLLVSANPASQSICSGASTVPVNWNSNQPNTTTTWTLSANPNIVGAIASGTGAIPAMTLTNTSNIPQNIVYSATSTANGLTVTNAHTITVNPTPVITANPNLTYCNGTQSAVISFTGTGTSFSWTNSNTAIGLGASGNGNIAPFTTTNPGVNAVSATIAVTPIFMGNGIFCNGIPNNFSITVNATPTITNNTLTQSICSGVNTSSVFWTSNVAGTTYSWTGVGSSPTLTGFTASGSGNLPAMTIINSSNSVQTVTYTVTPTTNGCSGPGITYTIIVNPTPQLTLYPNQVICSGTTTLITSHINSVAGGGFTYSLFNAAGIPPSIIGYPVSGSGQIPAATITNMDMNPYTLNYTVTPTANGCSGTSGLYTITVYPAPAILFSTVNQTICSGQNTNVVNISSPTQGVTINWSIQGAIPAGIGNVNVISGTNFIPAYQNVTNSTNAPITIGFTAFAVSQGPIQCPGSPGTYLITINPLPSVFAGNNQTVCNGSQVTLTASGATTYLWNNGVQNGEPFTPNATQTYVVTGTNANGCQNYDTIVVTVNNPSSSIIDSVACAPFLLNGQTYNQSGTYSQTIPNVQGCDSSITLNLTINNLPTTPIITVDSNNVLSIFGQANCTYQWVFCSTGFAIAGEVDTLFTPTTNGVYAVQATNDCGTSTSQCVTINNVSLSELGSMISVFPNPTFSEITVMSDQLSHEEYIIHDQMGRDVSSGFLQGSTTLIDFGNLSKGIYILKIQGISTPIAVVKE
jgi:hypothetical protein